MFYDCFLQACEREHIRPYTLLTRLGLSTGNISRWKNGGAPSVEVLEQLARELHCSVDALLHSVPAGTEAVPAAAVLTHHGERAADQAADLLVSQVIEGFPVYREKALLTGRRAQSAADELLLRQTRLGFPLDVERLRYPCEMLFDSYRRYGELTGLSAERLRAEMGEVLTLAFDGGASCLLLYDEGLEEDDRRWRLAREVGHILLRRCEGTVSPRCVPSEADEGQEADSFAEELLAPASVVLECLRRWRELTPERVADTFGIPLSAAGRRIETLPSPAADSAGDLLLSRLSPFPL